MFRDEHSLLEGSLDLVSLLIHMDDGHILRVIGHIKSYLNPKSM